MNGSIKFNCCTYLSLIMIFFQLWSLLLLFLKMHYLNTFSFKVIFFSIFKIRVTSAYAVGITVYSLVWALHRPTSWVTLNAVLMISQPCNNKPYSISLFTNSVQMQGREGPTKCQFYKFFSCTILQNSRTCFSETGNKKPGDYFLSSLKASVYVQSSITERDSICFRESIYGL